MEATYLRLMNQATQALLVFAFTACLALSIDPLHAQVAPSCPSVESNRKAELIDYVRKKYKVPQSVSLSILQDTTVPDTCFHFLMFHGKGDIKEWDLPLYSSPDLRFLFNDVLDTKLDPSEEERRKSSQLMAGLKENKSASSGPDDALVSVVEFSDFECPFCKNFAGVLKEVLSTEDTKVHLVFHHMPLSIHPWARRAAEGAACAQLQGTGPFWAIHDDLFAAQEQLSIANVDSQLIKWAAATKGIDLPTFKSCLENEMSLGLVFRDTNLALSNGVHATPTVFINGRQVSNVGDAVRLKQALLEAEREARGISPSSNGRGGLEPGTY